jgi:hypothetical protein
MLVYNCRMNRHSTEFKGIAAEIAAGKLTRNEACEKYGIKYPTLASWLLRSRIKVPDGRSNPDNAGYQGIVAHRLAAKADDPTWAADMAAAVESILAGEATAYGINKADPRLNMNTLNSRVREERVKRGLESPRKPSPKNVQDAAEAVRRARRALAEAESELEKFLQPT